MRKQKAPIVPENTTDGNADNFKRMQNKLTDKDKETFMNALKKQGNVNEEVVRRLLVRKY